MRFLLFLFLGLLFVSSCNKKVTDSAGTSAPRPPRNSQVAKVVRAMNDNKVSTEFMEARAKVDLRSDKLSIGGTATIRLEHDKAIWMVVKKFGFEGARVLIRPDSFFLHNRLEGEYVAEPLSYIEEKYEMPARFDLLEDIILGNAVFFTEELRLQTSGTDYILEGRDARYDTRYVVDPVAYQLKEMQLNELADSRGVTVSNSNFQQLEGLARPFPTERTVSIQGGSAGNASIQMTFDRMGFSGPLDMPFSSR